MSRDAPFVAGLLNPPRIFRELGPDVLSWAAICAPGRSVSIRISASEFRIDAFPVCPVFIIATRPAAVLITTGDFSEGFSVFFRVLQAGPGARLGAAAKPAQPAAAVKFEWNARTEAIVIERLLNSALADSHEPNPQRIANF